MSEYVLGPISKVCGQLTTVYTHRPDPETGAPREVENEDSAQLLVQFDSGVRGSMDISRIASGKKCGLCIEVYCSNGSLSFDQERMNELRIFRSEGPASQRGYRTVLSGPEHEHYASFCPASGHGLGINDLKVIEIRNFIYAIDNDASVFSDFANGWRVQRIMDAVEQSNVDRAWVSVDEV
jgi:predicted dehydrogenase